MNWRSLLRGLLVIVVAMGSTFARDQKSLRGMSEQHTSMISASDVTKPVLKEIQDIEWRTVAIAEDFPDELYNTYRPKGDPDVRTAAEILLHIAEQNESAASLIRTKPQQDALIASGKKRAAKDIVRRGTKSDRRESRSEEAGVVDLCHCAQQRPLRKSGDLLPRKRARATELTAIVGNGPTLPETRNGMK